MALFSVVMPELGEGVVEGEVQKWLVSPGDKIQEDQVLVEIMTDKASVEVPSTVSGTVKELKVKEGQVCLVGNTLLKVEVSSSVQKQETPSQKISKQQTQETPSTPLSTWSAEDTSSSKSTPDGSTDISSIDSVLALPMVRKKAKEWGVDLKQVQGTGLSGRITLADIEKFKPTGASPQTTHSGFSIPVLGKEERVPLKGIRKKIAEKMQVSKQVIPHFTLVEQADVEELYKLKNLSKKLNPDVKVTYLPFIMKILYQCLLEFPELNASIDDVSGEIVYKKYYNFGIAADTPQGLLVPVVKDVDQKNIIQLSQEIVDLAMRARSGKIKVDEMQGATVTITNIGSVSGQWATPIINPPEVCILGMYRIFERPVWKEDSFQPVRTMNFSLTSDHRLIDGAVAARFMSKFIERIEKPSLILIEG